MYKSEFDKHIQNKTVSNSFIFFGESIFLIDMYTKMLSNIQDAQTLTLFYDEYNFATAKTHLNQSSLFGGNNILIVKNDKKIPKKELDILLDLCEKNHKNLFIFAYYGSDHKTYNNKKSFGKRATMSVRFFHPKGYEAQNILLHIATQENVKIDKFTLSHLLDIHNGDIALAANELTKLKVYDKEITTKDIDTLVYGLSEINMEKFILNILNKKEFLTDLQQLLQHGEDEIKILTAITSYLTGLYMFNIYIRTNGAPNAMEILGYNAPKFIVEEKAAMSLKFKPKTYLLLHNLLLESELKMKSSHNDKSAILFSTLIQLQRLL